jgi:hypothetical protein
MSSAVITENDKEIMIVHSLEIWISSGPYFIKFPAFSMGPEMPQNERIPQPL